MSFIVGWRINVRRFFMIILCWLWWVMLLKVKIICCFVDGFWWVLFIICLIKDFVIWFLNIFDVEFLICLLFMFCLWLWRYLVMICFLCWLNCFGIGFFVGWVLLMFLNCCKYVRISCEIFVFKVRLCFMFIL